MFHYPDYRVTSKNIHLMENDLAPSRVRRIVNDFLSLILSFVYYKMDRQFLKMNSPNQIASTTSRNKKNRFYLTRFKIVEE